MVELDLGLFAELVADLVADRLAKPAAASPWLDVAGAADHLNCSPERVRKLVAQRQIPFHQERSGARLFFHRKELDDWLVEQ